jgi:hypothetical protein
VGFITDAAEGTTTRTGGRERRRVMGSASQFISGPVSKEIRRIATEAARSGRIVSATETAATILKTYPTCGLDEEEIANEVMLLAAEAGVGVQIGRPAKPDGFEEASIKLAPIPIVNATQRVD